MAGHVLIYGGRGALGAVCLDFFASQGWWTCNVDVGGNERASSNVLVTKMDCWNEQAKEVETGVEKALNGAKLDAIVCVAGGWAGGNAASPDFIKSCENMWKQSVWTSVIAAQLGSKFLKENGLIQLTGAKAALDYTPEMIGYGMAKAAVHQLVSSLNSSRSGLPKHTTTVAILPVTLDTPMNRTNMPKADHSTWTPLEFVANLLFQWASEKDSRPASGSLVELKTKDGKTDMVIGQLQQPTKLAHAY